MNNAFIEIWNNLNKEERLAILTQTGEQEGLPAGAIEKDWYVTLALNLVFSTVFSKYLVFKGGTSLSKGWNLIERFSEDIDLAIEREFLGFKGDLSKSQVKKLRKASCSFITSDFRNSLIQKIDEVGVQGLNVNIPEFKDSDTDPVVIELNYNPITQDAGYLPPRVQIEIGARSLREPFETRNIQSIIGKHFPHREFTDPVALIPTVLPMRTFLEKAFLLHEEFQKPTDKVRIDRLSRHLYDLDKLSETEHANDAFNDKELYNSIIAHRETFNHIKGIDYNNHRPDQINFIPPDAVLKAWEDDYKAMQESMIYRESKNFKALLQSMEKLTERFRKLS